MLFSRFYDLNFFSKSIRKKSLFLILFCGLLFDAKAPILRTISSSAFLNSKRLKTRNEPAVIRKSPKKQIRNTSGMILYDLTHKKVIKEKGAENSIAPASLTKIMTFYIAADLIKKGKISLNDNVYISKNAEKQIPTKLGLKAGSYIKLKDALRAVMILSANDIAHAVGEHIGGSKFSEIMNQYARKLKMFNTIFRNATGLYHREKATTPKDMLKLIVALRRYFPDFIHYGEGRNFCHNGHCRANHNKLIGPVQGVVGLKTGFLAHCGWHVATYSKLHGREFVGVFMGHSSSNERNKYAADLIRQYNRDIFKNDMNKKNEQINVQLETIQEKPAAIKIIKNNKPLNKKTILKKLKQRNNNIRKHASMKTRKGTKNKHNHEDFLSALI